MNVKITGKFHNYYEFKNGYIDIDDVREGDILLHPKLDAAGRIAASGGHANRGYSGYFTGFLYAEGAAKRFLNWKDLWPIAENTYEAQQDRPRALRDMAVTLERLAGSQMIKTKGGWCLERNVNELLGRQQAE